MSGFKVFSTTHGFSTRGEIEFVDLTAAGQRGGF